MLNQHSAPPSTRKRGGRPKSDGPDAADVYAGGRMKERRILIGMSQDALAKQLGLTFQQVQKYEKGTNRMGASRLTAAARILGVSPLYFFQETVDTESSPQFTRETLELVRNFLAIPEGPMRKAIYSLVKLQALFHRDPAAEAEAAADLAA